MIAACLPACLAAAAAMANGSNASRLGDGWPTVAQSNTQAVEWRAQPGSARRLAGEVYVVLMRHDSATADSTQARSFYKASIKAEQCATKYGEVRLSDLAGQQIEVAAFTRGGHSTAAKVAAYACRASEAPR